MSSPPIKHGADEPPERGRHDRERRSQALTEAATAVFAEYGYDAATTRAVAARAGCAEGLIHRYFGGKRGLLKAILESKAEHITAHAQAMLPDRETLREEVQHMLAHGLDLAQEHKDFMRVAVSQAAIDPEIGRTIAAGLNRARVRVARDKLERHRAAGRVRADADLDAAAEAIMWIAFDAGFMSGVAMGRDERDLRRLLDGATDLIVRGLEPPPEPQCP